MTLVLFCPGDSRVPRGCLVLVGREGGEAPEMSFIDHSGQTQVWFCPLMNFCIYSAAIFTGGLETIPPKELLSSDERSWPH